MKYYGNSKSSSRSKVLSGRKLCELSSMELYSSSNMSNNLVKEIRSCESCFQAIDIKINKKKLKELTY